MRSIRGTGSACITRSGTSTGVVLLSTCEARVRTTMVLILYSGTSSTSSTRSTSTTSGTSSASATSATSGTSATSTAGSITCYSSSTASGWY